MIETKIIKIANYQGLELIHESARILVYRGHNVENEQPIIIKLMRNQYPSFRELVQFRNQYVISKNLEIEGIIKTYSLQRYENRYALIMEDMGGVSLAEYQARVSLSLSQFLDLAIQLSEILHQLHNNSIIHKDIKPANILIHPETKQVKLIDFSISSLLPKETQTIQTTNVLEGTLAYISPEQTGRMNRAIDYRSDFYSLGVTFYELLMGTLPFRSDDALELIHAHIALSPEPLSDLLVLGGDLCPQTLSHIVLKLMAKNAEERYQSALGLKYDLEKCRKQWLETGKIVGFELGERDICDRFLIPEKLYGREQEIQTLLEAFSRVAEGKSEMMLVAGFSGIGKTAVINEVHKPIVKQRGYFIKGKFDQFNRNIPFSAIIIAFRNLMRQLLGESDAELDNWKTKILEAVGTNGQVLIDVIPELESVIGKQAPAPELSGSAAQNRFNLLFEKFIAVFTTQEHPLTIFLDDLQWADSASLNLMKVLMGNSTTGYLLLLGAYRDNEVFPAHPLMLTLAELEKRCDPAEVASAKEREPREQKAVISTITLAPLSVHHINQLVAETLRCLVEQSQPLTKLVYQKTNGNPFFTTQFLKGLYKDKLIVFNRNLRYWECDLVKVRDAALTDDVVEFMAGRLQKLPTGTQEVLKLAACIGNQFDLETLAIVRENSLEEVASELWNGLQEGLILPISEAYKFFQGDLQESQTQAMTVGYRFLHDRVQQAAYSLIPEDQKAKTHYHIGELLLQEIPIEARKERIFELVSQLNYGNALISNQSKRDELAQLNLLACRKARAATAYQGGREYASIGLSLLGENAWQRQYEMTFAFHNLAAELASLCGEFEAMENFVEVAIAQSRSVLDNVNLYQTRILSKTYQNKIPEALAIGKNFLQQLGVTFPDNPSESDIQQVVVEIDNLIGEREIRELVELPVMSDDKQKAIVEIAYLMTLPAYLVGATALFVLLSARIVNLSLSYGNTPISAFAYVNYSFINCNLLQQVEKGIQLGQLALDIVSKFDDKPIKAAMMVTLAISIWPRKFPLRETIPAMRENYVLALETGKLEWAANSAHNLGLNSFLVGLSLGDIAQEIHPYDRGLVQLNQLIPARWCRMHLQVCLNLLGVASHPCVLGEDRERETEFLTELFRENELAGLSMFNLYKLMLSYLFEDIESALNYADEAQKYLVGTMGMMTQPWLYFYDALTTLAALQHQLLSSSQAGERVAKNLGELQEHWASHAPMNFQHKCDLIEAERHQVLGEKLEAIDLYDHAIVGAKENEYIQEEALANELAAKFYLNWGKEKIACTYMQEAYYCYAQWGAKAKTYHLEKHYPQLLCPIFQQQLDWTANSKITTLTQGTVSNTSTSTGELLDLASLMKASRSLSQEIDLKGAIANFIQVIQENAGAETVALMLFQADTLILTAHRKKEEMSLISIPVDTSNNVPLTLINQVKNTRAHLVLDNATEDKDYNRDAYIQKHQPQSVLCIPLIDRGQLRGILYLENNQTSGAFTSDRIEILNLLCSQAAIALQNSQLYHKEQQARNDLQQALTDLQQAQLQLVQSEKMATLGNMVAGVAHEINNPIGFIGGNISTAQEYVQDLLQAVSIYQENTSPSESMITELEDLDLDFIAEDFPKMIVSMEQGCDRIRHISKSLRTFSRTDTAAKTEFNLHDGIDSTLLILKYRLKANENRPAIEVVKNYSDIPLVKCYAGQLNQVFMNLLANAIDALDESNQGKTFQEIEKEPNQITITTEFSEDNNQVIVSIADNGTGMPEEVKARLFEQGFTTKGVGKGTGLGMAIAHQIVTEKHGGQISCDSRVGQGTIFRIMIPR
ncbi:MAG: AAA family ATPase [Okeania sp. SIO2D1]|nr:AAA family ATPase [Okeania sp. SIO2D1]